MKILGYYQIDIEVKKDWFWIIFTICLGTLEIIGGCILLCYTQEAFWNDLIEEGYSDIKLGVEYMIGIKEFSWSIYKTLFIKFFHILFILEKSPQLKWRKNNRKRTQNY